MVFKHLMTPSPLRNRSPNTLPNIKIRNLAKVKVGEKVTKTRATTAKIGGRKSRLLTKVGKENQRARRRR